MSKVFKRRIVLGVTGSIAAYKAAEVARHFVKRGYTVRVVMTEAAQKFISSLTFESITGQPVATSFWDETKPGAIGHIALADWADAVVVAPASADFIAKASFGFAESPLLAVLLATKAPVIMAPAMNVNMYEHAATQDNIEKLRGRGVLFVEPDSGDLACGWKGRGRLAEATEIFAQTRRALSNQDLAGRKVLITTGPTREPIDPVRYISNRSSGKMGVSLALEAYRRGAEVTVIHGPLTGTPRLPRGVARVPVTTAAEMRDAVLSRLSDGFDIVVMAAAVADFRPENPAEQKIKKTSAPSIINLSSNPDILREVGERKGGARVPFLVGFAVETGGPENLISEVKRKLEQKNADLVVGNLAEDSFDKDTNRVWLVSRDGREQEVTTARKSRIAMTIFDAILRS